MVVYSYSRSGGLILNEKMVLAKNMQYEPELILNLVNGLAMELKMNGSFLILLGS